MTAEDQVLTEGVMSRRFFAWLIDTALIGVFATFAFLVASALNALAFGNLILLLLLVPLVPLAYHAPFIAGSWSATPGQVMQDLVMRRNQDLGRPGWVRAVVFTAGLWLTALSGFVLLVLALFTRRHRAPHEMVAGLVIVRKHALTAAAASMNMRAGTASR